MALTIKPNTSIDYLKRKLGKGGDKHLSPARRRYLETLASLHSGEDVYVEISGNQASVDIAPRESEFGFTDRIVITIPAEIPEQPETTLDEESWMLLFQKAELYHELGHILYTDWEAFEHSITGATSRYKRIEKQYRGAYKNWWNFLEDAAIERLLARRFNIAQDLRIKNANIFADNKPPEHIGLHEAISIALAEYKHPTHRLDDLLSANEEPCFLADEDRELFEDEALPIIEEYAPIVVSEGDAERRVELIHEMALHLIEVLEAAVSPGESTKVLFGSPDDPENSIYRNDPENVDMDEEEQEEMKEKDALSNMGADIDAQRDYDNMDDGMDDDVENQYDDIEQWVRVIDTEYDLGTSMNLHIPDNPPEDGTFNQDTANEARRLCHPLARELEQRLQMERQSKKVGGQRTGKPDNKSLHKTQRGKVNVFKRRVEPDEKDYSCIIIVDRSGSMQSFGGPDMVPDVESASGALACALDDVGVEVAQLSIYNDSIWLEKSFSESVDEASNKMFRGVSEGGTPLSDALLLAKARLNDKGGHPFVVTITDGEPDNRERYRDVLHECNFPVLGIYVSKDGEFDNRQANEASYFHALEYRKYDEVLAGARNLVKKVMF